MHVEEERKKAEKKEALKRKKDKANAKKHALLKLKSEFLSSLLDSDMEKLLTLSGVDENLLDTLYEAVQSYIEREVEPDEIEEEVDLSSLGINLEYEENENSEEDNTVATLEEE